MNEKLDVECASSSADHATTRRPGSRRNTLLKHPLLRALVILLALSLYFCSNIAFSTRRGRAEPLPAGGIDFDKDELFKSINKTRLRDRLRYLTLIDRIAGSEGSHDTAEWVSEIYEGAGLTDIEVQSIPVYLNHPLPDGRSISILSPLNHTPLWTATLEEPLLYPPSTSPSPPYPQTPVFNGYSKNATHTGPLIYANYGSLFDFHHLTSTLHLNLTCSIVLVRYNGTQSDRGLKVSAAERAGAGGCIIYSDPLDDGFLQGPEWPEGRWRNKHGVQRGSVALSSFAMGDPLTPGWGSSPDAETIDKGDSKALVGIPSLPIGWADAQVLLQSLQGFGERVPEAWVGGVPDMEEGGGWWTGGQDSPVVELRNLQEEGEKMPIWNVLGSIEGWEHPEQVVYVGNHRDAWCQGAADPASGTVAMLEVIQLLGELKRTTGWRPRRTITFASWDGEEYNFLGSTEFVEGRLEEVRRRGVAYLNVDVGVVGDTFRADGSPLLRELLLDVLKDVRDPVSNVSIGKLWRERNGQYNGLAAGSDYVPFQDLAGIASLDFGFEGPGYIAPYHSCYESFEWMERFGDPGFAYHETLVKVWTLLVIELADAEVLKFDARVYAAEVKGYVKDLKAHAGGNVDLASLDTAAAIFELEARRLHSRSARSESGSLERDEVNRRLIQLEKDMLDLADGGGTPGREQYKHIIFGPQAWGGYDEAYFPAILDAIDDEDWDRAAKQTKKVAEILSHAAMRLTA